MPDLQMKDPARATTWHNRVGQEVIEGDRLLEVCCGPVAVDLPAPASGVLQQKEVEEDSILHPGQVLGIIVSRE